MLYHDLSLGTRSSKRIFSFLGRRWGPTDGIDSAASASQGHGNLQPGEGRRQHEVAVDESLGAKMAADGSSNGSGGDSKKKDATSASKPEVSGCLDSCSFAPKTCREMKRVASACRVVCLGAFSGAFGVSTPARGNVDGLIVDRAVRRRPCACAKRRAPCESVDDGRRHRTRNCKITQQPCSHGAI